MDVFCQPTSFVLRTVLPLINYPRYRAAVPNRLGSILPVTHGAGRGRLPQILFPLRLLRHRAPNAAAAHSSLADLLIFSYFLTFWSSLFAMPFSTTPALALLMWCGLLLHVTIPHCGMWLGCNTTFWIGQVILSTVWRRHSMQHASCGMLAHFLYVSAAFKTCLVACRYRHLTCRLSSCAGSSCVVIFSASSPLAASSPALFT